MTDKPFSKNVALDFESELLQGRSDKAEFERVEEKSDKASTLAVYKRGRL